VLPDSVSDEAAVFLADILPTGYGSVVRGGVDANSTVVVVGCGPVGLMAILAAVGTARRVIAVDGIAERRELAALLGAQPAEPAEAQAAVAQATDGMGADVVIEAAGSPGALDASLRLARGRGTISVVGAHFEPDYPLNNALMFEHELTLRFTIGDPSLDGAGLLARVADGTLDPTPVITHRMPLADAAEAYRLFDERSATKVVLTP
jgi:threonine dehydrogenase-like Zn-dependent dehydrogenase